jgi:PAS domain S-box-containing protein
MRPFTDSAKWLALTLSSDGLITSLSPSTEQLTGYSAQELVGRPITHILTDRSVFEISVCFDSAREWGFWDGEVVFRNRSGKSFEARSSLTSMGGRENGITGFSFIALLSAGGEIGGVCRGPLYEVGARLRSLSHEINNPLAVAMGFTQLLILNANGNGKVRSDMEKLYSEITRVSQVVERLHEYAVELQREKIGETQDEVILAG